jgi:hypothetical protein
VFSRAREQRDSDLALAVAEVQDGAAAFHCAA